MVEQDFSGLRADVQRSHIALMQLLPGEELCAVYITLAHQLRMALRVLRPSSDLPDLWPSL